MRIIWLLLFFCMESEKITYVLARQKIFLARVREDDEFWAKVEKNILGSFDLESSAPNLPPTMMPSPRPSPMPNGKPTLSTTPSYSSAPMTTTAPTVTARPGLSHLHRGNPNGPSSSISPSQSSLPTSSPNPTITLSPTSSVRPSSPAALSRESAEPSTTTCAIAADIVCRSEGSASCDFFNPIGKKCIGENAQELRFIYVSHSACTGNNTQANFFCVDQSTTNKSRPFSVHIKAFLGKSIFFEGIVNEGNVFSIFITNNSNSINIEIRDLTESFDAGELLQTMTMSVRCREEDSVTLLDTFGSLQLVGYRNKDEGLKSIFADLTILYSATNVGTRDLFLTSGFKTTPMTGTQSLLSTTDGILSVPGDIEIFSEILTVNLAALVGGLELNFSLVLNGEDTVTGDECEDSDSYSLKIVSR